MQNGNGRLPQASIPAPPLTISNQQTSFHASRVSLTTSYFYFRAIMASSAANSETLITIKITIDGATSRHKLPLKDLGINVFEDKVCGVRLSLERDSWLILLSLLFDASGKAG